MPTWASTVSHGRLRKSAVKPMQYTTCPRNSLTSCSSEHERAGTEISCPQRCKWHANALPTKPWPPSTVKHSCFKKTFQSIHVAHCRKESILILLAISKDALIYSEKSCFSKSKPSKINTPGSRLRGNDDFFSVSLRRRFFAKSKIVQDQRQRSPAFAGMVAF